MKKSGLGKKLAFYDNKPKNDEFLNAIENGLEKTQKEIPCKFLYDERGSKLFDKICTLDEYYPTRTELHIMHSNIDDIAHRLGDHVLLIEYGSGSSLKTRVLLDRLQNLSGYIPIDISGEHLLHTASEIKKQYPDLPVHPVCADYTGKYNLPEIVPPDARRVVYFPGSTIGNFHPEDAAEFLRTISTVIHNNGFLLIGVDLKKDPVILHRAYNDRQGVTALFNLNSLVRANRELGANFRTDLFKHYAFFNPTLGRVEMHLISLEDQKVHINGTTFAIAQGESIHTECSYKYSVNEFAELAKNAGLEVDRVWMDEDKMFSVQLLRAGL